MTGLALESAQQEEEEIYINLMDRNCFWFLSTTL